MLMDMADAHIQMASTAHGRTKCKHAVVLKWFTVRMHQVIWWYVYYANPYTWRLITNPMHDFSITDNLFEQMARESWLWLSQDIYQEFYPFTQERME